MHLFLSITLYSVILGIFLFHQSSCNNSLFDYESGQDQISFGQVYDGCSSDPRFSSDIKNTVERAALQGFRCQCHNILTLDNYIIQIHRIGSFKGPPILFLHGFLTASEQWLSRSRTEDLPSIMADRGFDIWLGNYRGNTYGRKHMYLSPDNEETKQQFWNFTLHELGYYDLPSMIDYILKVTGRQTLSIVSYSLGVGVFLITTSTRPEYNEKINMAVLLAPYVFSSEEQNVQAVLNTLHIRDRIMEHVHNEPPCELFPRNKNRIRFINVNCKPHAISHFSCIHILTTCFGSGQVHNYNQNGVYRVINSFMAGTSNKLIEHLLQMIESGKFHNFRVNDGDALEEYPLKDITVPMSIHSSINDTIADPLSVEMLVQHLDEERIVGRYLALEPYAHLDYFMSSKARIAIYPTIIELLLKVRDNQEVVVQQLIGTATAMENLFTMTPQAIIQYTFEGKPMVYRKRHS